LSSPIPPKNVRLRLADGTAYPLELAYRGLDDEGFHQWEVTENMRDRFAAGMTVEADMVPPMTVIVLGRGR